MLGIMLVSIAICCEEFLFRGSKRDNKETYFKCETLKANDEL